MFWNINEKLKSLVFEGKKYTLKSIWNKFLSVWILCTNIIINVLSTFCSLELKSTKRFGNNKEYHVKVITFKYFYNKIKCNESWSVMLVGINVIRIYIYIYTNNCRQSVCRAHALKGFKIKNKIII